MANIKKTKSGTCPYCGSDDIDYVDSDYSTISDEMYFDQTCMCKACMKYFREYFTMKYDGYYAEVPFGSGRYIDYDENGKEM